MGFTVDDYIDIEIDVDCDDVVKAIRDHAFTEEELQKIGQATKVSFHKTDIKHDDPWFQDKLEILLRIADGKTLWEVQEIEKQLSTTPIA